MPDHSLRERLVFAGLRRRDALPDPLAQFKRWYQDALDAAVDQPEAMTLATATREGHPSARVVLLKDLDDRGFIFFTNYESQKGIELAQNRHVCLNFFWKEIMRQVRIAGEATKISMQESEIYFHSRPFESQVGAWASPQSRVLHSRDEMDERFMELKTEHEGRTVPLPPYWGGYVVVPTAIEYWAARPNRMHDRILYTRTMDGWRIERLAP